MNQETKQGPMSPTLLPPPSSAKGEIDLVRTGTIEKVMN
jgi:hypothetical protein